jgi:DNA-directed RNA polymerase specialized sigma24 family protein
MSAQLEDSARVGSLATQAAVEECYRAEHARLWRSLLLFTGDADLASDAVSEAFTQALHRGTAIRDLRRWVWRAAFAIARGELAARGRHVPELDDHPSVEMPAPTVDLVRGLRHSRRNSEPPSCYTTTPGTRTARPLRSSARRPRRSASTSSALGDGCESCWGTTMGDLERRQRWRRSSTGRDGGLRST